jgi:DNA-binding GntR family transcriptional regulator
MLTVDNRQFEIKEFLLHMGKPSALLESSPQTSNKTFEEISNVPLRQKIVTVLRDAILSGELKPGQALVETTLAAQFGVSRAPLREALRSLGKDGLIETIPYRGTTVKTLSRKDVEEIYSLRGLHESFAVQRIIERKRPEDVETLREICVRMRQAAQANDFKKLNQEDDNFHHQLILLAEHDMLTSIWEQVSLRVRQLMALTNQLKRDPLEVAQNHLPMVEAIANRNLKKATTLIQSHISSAKDLVLADLTKSLQT